MTCPVLAHRSDSTCWGLAGSGPALSLSPSRQWKEDGFWGPLLQRHGAVGPGSSILSPLPCCDLCGRGLGDSGQGRKLLSVAFLAMKEPEQLELNRILLIGISSNADGAN